MELFGAGFPPLLSDEDARAYSYAMEHHPEQEKQITMWLAIKYLRKDDRSKIRQDLRYDDIFNYDRRKEKSGLAQEIAKGVRSIEQATPGTIDYANAVSRQLCIAAYTLRSVFTVRGGSGDENRENEPRRHSNYEDLDDETSMNAKYGVTR